MASKTPMDEDWYWVKLAGCGSTNFAVRLRDNHIDTAHGRIHALSPTITWGPRIPSPERLEALEDVAEKARAVLKLHTPPTEDEPAECFDLSSALHKLDTKAPK